MKNLFWLLLGFIIGSIVNMGTITLGAALIPPPAGVDPEDIESIKAAMQGGLYQPVHFVTPFVAHALGTLAGAFAVARFVTSRPLHFALGLGGFFLLGGVMMAVMIPGPLWFAAFDMLGAYLPMAWLGAHLAVKKS